MASSANEFVKRKSVWFYAVVALLLVQYWALFDQALAGLPIGTTNDISSGVLLGGLCWWYIWKQLGRTPFIGSFIGVCFYLLLLFVAMVIQKIYVTV